jgi:predicted alpha/beta superfamily hydrolase
MRRRVAWPPVQKLELAMQTLYKTTRPLTRTLRIAYPPGLGKIVLHTELDWRAPVEPVSVSQDGTVSTFSITCKQPFLYFKPVLVQGGHSHWAVGANQLLLMSEADTRACYPYFFEEDGGGRASDLFRLPSAILGREHRLRVYVPPGYRENTLSRYPVSFIQDGQNLFFPEEAFMGNDWQVTGTNDTLRDMCAVSDRIIVGIHSADRMYEYTKPGYEKYARSLAEEILPEVRKQARVLESRAFTNLLGSSLGGVVSFYCAWQYPEVFGAAACMSSTFSYKDDLLERVMEEEPPDVAFYLDSGWPGDNYEVTAAMAVALVSRGWRYGHNLFYLSFPLAEHNESAWATRLHLPFQLGHGAVARYSRLRHPVLKDTPALAAGPI